MRRRRLPFQARIAVLTLAGGLPALLTAFLLLPHPPIADPVPRLRRGGLPFRARIAVLTLAGGLPALLTAFLLLRDAPIADSVLRLLVVILVGAWLGFAIAVHKATVEPLRSIANLLEALRGGDYAIRGRHGRKGDALGDIVLESNRLGATLRSQRFEAMESSALLNKVLAEVDVAV